MRDEKYRNLLDSTWALIGHELIATEDITRGMFSEETINKYPDLEERIQDLKNRPGETWIIDYCTRYATSKVREETGI